MRDKLCELKDHKPEVILMIEFISFKMNDENPTVILSNNIGDICPQVNNMTDFLKIYGKQTTSNFDLNKIAKQLGIKNFHILMRNELLLIKDVRNTNSTNKINNVTF